MNPTRTLSALLIALLAAGSAAAQTTDKRAFVVPHVLEASGRSSSVAAPAPADVSAPRDCASGMSAGKVVAGYDLKTNKGARTAPPSGCDAPGMAISEQGMPKPTHKGAAMLPPETGAAKHVPIGHVTLVK